MAHRSRRGFTLVELMVVVAIIALLGTIGATVTMWALAKARRSACASNLGELGKSAQAYELKYGIFPLQGGGHFWKLIYADPEPLGKDPKTYLCPETPDTNRDPSGTMLWTDNTAAAPTECSYGGPDFTKMGQGAGRIPQTELMGADDDEDAAGGSTQNHPGDGMNILYRNGRVKWADNSEGGAAGDLKVAGAGFPGDLALLANLMN